MGETAFATPPVVEEDVMKEIQELLELHLKRRRANTSRCYRAQWEEWEAWMRKRSLFLRLMNGVPKPTQKDVLLYRDELEKHTTNRGQPISQQTVHGILRNLRTMYDWLIDGGVISGPNAFKVPLEKPEEEERQPTQAMDWEKEVRPMFHCWNLEGGYEEIMKRAIIYILFSCALRRSEVWQLRDEDVRFGEEPYIVIRSTQKSKRTDKLPIPKFARAPLRQFRELRPTTDAPEFFVKADGKRVSDSMIRWIFKEALERCGLPTDKYSCHSARATAITELLNKGWSPRDVKAFSRHASVAMVEAYDKKRYTVSENPGNDLGE